MEGDIRIKIQGPQRAETDHRLELAGDIDGAYYINDSASVNIRSTVESVNSIQAEQILIIGGEDDRATDYGFLINAELPKVKAVIYLGREPERVLNIILKNACLFLTAGTIEEAVDHAIIWAKAGQVVVFSPACKSNEAFDNYKNRGNKFKSIVKSFVK